MSDKEKKSFKWLDKLKNIKHIEIYAAVLFIVILLLIYLSTTSKKSEHGSTTNSNELTVIAYVENLEQNLEDILSNIGGVSAVKVMITLNLNQVEVLDSKINLSKFPEIKGVIVTADGVNNTATKLKVLHAVEAVLEISNGSIEILSSS